MERESVDAARPASGERSEICDAMNRLLADLFALYVKTKNFHWHMSGPHFRDYHLMLDEQGEELFATLDPIAERIRKLRGKTIRSIGHIAQLQRIEDNDVEVIEASGMLSLLHADNMQLIYFMRDAHAICDGYGDVATASLIENWIDQAERRAWFLLETSQAS